MSKKVSALLERVAGDNCIAAVLSILADDMNPSNSFSLKETMQSMTRKVAVCKVDSIGDQHIFRFIL